MNNKLWISTGTWCRDTSWKSQETTWEKILDKLKKPVITKETLQQYQEMSKAAKTKIKDKGGFVGGIINGGNRLAKNVLSRSMVTLDVDWASMEFFEDFCLMFNWQAAIYATHSHTENNPRFRLIIPLSRDVLADEYEAVARWIAGKLGIDMFDPTTFQPERLMFWPSISKDVEYYQEEQDGPRLDPDWVLKRYADWRDSTLWPVSDLHKKTLLKSVGKQEDPLGKPGLIGAFCRIYTISSAIETYLKDTYIPTDYPDRYTYAHGSTFAGAVVYDDKFMFSHHSTDPTSYRLVNAFDLVRIHLYGDLDKNSDEKVPNNKLPSYLSTMDLISKDKQVKRLLLSEQVRSARTDFEGNESETVKSNNKKEIVHENVEPLRSDDLVEEDLEWTEKLDVDRKGNVLNTINNVVIILNHDEKLKGRLAYNQFACREVLLDDLPWRKVTHQFKDLTDSDDSSFRDYFENVYGITTSSKIADGISIVTRQHGFHPVRKYLKGLKWDQKLRVEELLIKYLGAEDTPFVREVTRKTLVAAVARVFEPGCKFDYMLTLIGPQGLGKSRLWNKLGKRWFSDTFGSLQNNSAMEQIQGVWIMEIGELAGLKRQEVEAVKLFIAKREDMFRPAYGRRVESFPRQNIFIGTTNDRTPLKDITGGRRFWPVEVSLSMRQTEKEHGEITEELADQIWAEACYWYAMGEDLYLSEEMELQAKVIQESYTEQDDRVIAIENYLEVEVPGNWYDLNAYDRRSFLAGDEAFGKGEFVRNKITVPEIWVEAFGGNLRDMTPFNVKYIRSIMDHKMPGWERKMVTVKGYGNQRGWVNSGIKKVAQKLQ